MVKCKKMSVALLIWFLIQIWFLDSNHQAVKKQTVVFNWIGKLLFAEEALVWQSSLSLGMHIE